MRQSVPRLFSCINPAVDSKRDIWAAYGLGAVMLCAGLTMLRAGGGWVPAGAVVLSSAVYGTVMRIGPGALPGSLGLAVGSLVAAAGMNWPLAVAILIVTGSIRAIVRLALAEARRAGWEEARLEYEKRLHEVQYANQALASETEIDPLTGLLNRRGLERRIQLAGQRRAALILLDVDQFKRYNDTHGHPAGDILLRRLARIIRDAVRAGDTAFRAGGEEFGVFLPATDLETAAAVAERIRHAVASEPFPGRQTQPGGRVTVSVGVATGSAADPGLYEAADKALYEAKNRGRNAVVVSHHGGGR